jgi:hypothetical protein
MTLRHKVSVYREIQEVNLPGDVNHKVESHGTMY